MAAMRRKNGKGRAGHVEVRFEGLPLQAITNAANCQDRNGSRCSSKILALVR